MALIDEVAFSLTRMESVTDTNLITEFNGYINAAIYDLTRTTDIKPFTALEADDLQKRAIILYAHYCFELDVSRKDAYKRSYDDLKTQLAMSSQYSTLGETIT